MTAGSIADGSPRRLADRWVAVAILVLGAFMVLLDTTIVNVGLPSIQRDFEVFNRVEWVVTAYLVAVGVTQMTSGWAGDRFGRRPSFIGALVCFTAGSGLCAIAPTFWALVLARVLQGVGGGLLIPIALTMMHELFDPADRGRAMGMFGIAVTLAPAIGPVLGGAIVSSVGWRWLFLVNVPVGAVGVAVAVRLLRESGVRERRPFDHLGLLLSASGLVGILIGLQQAGEWGWASVPVATLLLGGASVLAMFGVHALRTPAPLVDVRILGNGVVAISLVAIAAIGVAHFSRLVYVPLLLESTRGSSALGIGVVMTFAAAGIVLTMPLGGRLVDRVGARVPVTVGLAVLAVSFLPLADMSAETHVAVISAALFVGGLGIGLAFMAPQVVAMNSVTASQVGQTSGLIMVTRQLAAGFGVAALASVLATSNREAIDRAVPRTVETAVNAYSRMYLGVFVLLLVGLLIVALLLPGKDQARRLQEQRRDELRIARTRAD